jgi:hypothetical protein
MSIRPALPSSGDHVDIIGTSGGSAGDKPRQEFDDGLEKNVKVQRWS